VTFHQYFCSGVSGSHPHIRQDLDGTLAASSVGSAHPTVAQAICQLGKILLRHGQDLVPRLHHGSAWCACGSGQDIGHS
jgi:hypothetical protein